MKEQTTISRNFKIITFLLIAIGAGTIVFGLITDRRTTWTNYLIVNYYFFFNCDGRSFLFRYSKHFSIGLVISIQEGFQKP